MAEGTSLLADGLKCNTVLLYNNNIGNDGAAVLGEALIINTSLTDLRLSFNRVGDEGAAALGAALEDNATLTELDMEHNRIGEEGATLLLKALMEFNITLTELYLSGNDALS
jgi:NLR family CARD domain-containing protein 3